MFVAAKIIVLNDIKEKWGEIIVCILFNSTEKVVQKSRNTPHEICPSPFFEANNRYRNYQFGKVSLA